MILIERDPHRKLARLTEDTLHAELPTKRATTPPGAVAACAACGTPIHLSCELLHSTFLVFFVDLLQKIDVDSTLDHMRKMALFSALTLLGALGTGGVRIVAAKGGLSR